MLSMISLIGLLNAFIIVQAVLIDHISIIIFTHYARV